MNAASSKTRFAIYGYLGFAIIVLAEVLLFGGNRIQAKAPPPDDQAFAATPGRVCAAGSVGSYLAAAFSFGVVGAGDLAVLHIPVRSNQFATWTAVDLG